MIDDARLSASLEAMRILRSRARVLARPAEVAATGAGSLELLEFRLGHERYALETRYVQEVYPLKDLTPLPCTPPFILGIVNVRGRIVALLDIRRFFDLPQKGFTDLHQIILVRGNDFEFGLLAGAIVGVLKIDAQDLQPALPTLTGIRADYLKGVTSERLVVLELAHILMDPKILVHEEVENAPSNSLES